MYLPNFSSDSFFYRLTKNKIKNQIRVYTLTTPYEDARHPMDSFLKRERVLMEFWDIRGFLYLFEEFDVENGDEIWSVLVENLLVSVANEDNIHNLSRYGKLIISYCTKMENYI